MKALKAWMARDYDGSLYMYIDKPKKLDDTWSLHNFCFFKLDDSLFPEVQWSDEEPKEIRLSIRDNMEKSKIKSSLSFLGRITLFVFILWCTVMGIFQLFNVLFSRPF